MMSCHSTIKNEVVNSYATINKNSAVLKFIFLDNNQYNFIRYARETIIQWLPVKTVKSGSQVTVYSSNSAEPHCHHKQLTSSQIFRSLPNASVRLSYSLIYYLLQYTSGFDSTSFSP